MPKEFLLDEDATHRQWVRPDETGFTLRTQYKGTPGVLDQNARERNSHGKHARVNTKGSAAMPAVRVPLELYEQLTLEMGREPTAEELIALARTPEYAALRLIDKRFL